MSARVYAETACCLHLEYYGYIRRTRVCSVPAHIFRASAMKSLGTTSYSCACLEYIKCLAKYLGILYISQYERVRSHRTRLSQCRTISLLRILRCRRIYTHAGPHMLGVRAMIPHHSTPRFCARAFVCCRLGAEKQTVCLTRRIEMCDRTHSYVQHKTTNKSCVRSDSFMFVT